MNDTFAVHVIEGIDELGSIVPSTFGGERSHAGYP